MSSAGITVWYVAVDMISERTRSELIAILNDTERTRASRFRLQRHALHYIAAHALKRLSLSHAVDMLVAPQQWRFDAVPGGKPRVAPEANPHFNLSHCDGMVACAVSLDAELGVDVERITASAPLEVAAANFAPPEVAWLNELPAAHRSAGFFRIWTLREAYAKATGHGLAEPHPEIEFRLSAAAVECLGPTLEAQWRFYQRPVGADHMLALAWQSASPDPPVVVEAVLEAGSLPDFTRRLLR